VAVLLSGERRLKNSRYQGLHHPRFVADEDALPIGAALHASFALRSLEALSA